MFVKIIIYFWIVFSIIDHATSSLLMFLIELTLLLLSAKVNEELEKYSASITGVPYFVVGDKNSQFVNFIFRYNYPSRSIHTIGFSWQINGSQKLSGAQPPEVFLRAFQVV